MDRIEKARATLKLLAVKRCCDETNMDYKRIRNFICGCVKNLKDWELDALDKYIADNFK